MNLNLILDIFSHHTAGEVYLVFFSCPQNYLMLAFTKGDTVWVDKSASTDIMLQVHGEGRINRLKFKLTICTFNLFNSVDLNCLM